MYPLLTAIGDIVRAPEFRGHRPPAVALIAAGALVIGGRILLALQIPGASLNPRAIALELLCALAFLGFVYLSAALHRAPAVMLSLIYALLYTANLEMIAAMDTVVELQDVVFAADEVFLSGSAAGLQFGWYGLILTAAFVLFAVLAGRAHRRHRCSKRRLAIGSAALLALAAALYLAPSGVTWLDDGLVRTSLRSTVRRAALTAADRPLHSLAQGDAELPRHTPAGPGTPGAPDASDQPRAAAETRGDLDGELLIPQAEGERNVLLVIVEGIPGVYLEQVQAAAELPYEVTMPRFSEIADLGLLATQSVAHARQTVRGLYSALTGDYPRLNLATPKIYPYMQADEADRPPGLAAAMRELGYRSVYLQAAELSYMSKDRFMPEVGFEEVLGEDAFEYSHVPFEWGPDDKAYFEQVAEFIDELNNDDEPWFLSLLTVGTHHPYGVTDEFAADYPSRKIAAVAYLDEALGEFLERLEAAGHLEDTAVFIVSDESHGVTGHLLGRYWGTTVVRTPELRRTPQSEKPILQEQPVGLRDLPITILDYLGAEEQALRFAGRSVLRTHDSPRELWFGPYIAKPGEESTDGEENANRETAGMRVYHVPEGGRFDMYLPSTGSPFAPEYTRRTKRENEHRELAERLRDSYWAATHIPGVEYALDATDEPRVDPRKQSWVLVEDLRETVGAEESLILSGAQYLEIPAETNAELHLNLSVAEAPDGDEKLIRPALQVLAEYEPVLAGRRPAHREIDAQVRPGDGGFLLLVGVGIDELDPGERVSPEHRIDEPLVPRRDAAVAAVVGDERSVELRPRRQCLRTRHQRGVDGVSEPVDDPDVGVERVDPLVYLLEPVDAGRLNADDLLQHEVRGVESERELVGAKRAEGLLAADELESDVAEIHRRGVEDDPTRLPVSVVAHQRELGFVRLARLRVVEKPLVRARLGLDASLRDRLLVAKGVAHAVGKPVERLVMADRRDAFEDGLEGSALPRHGDRNGIAH